MNDLSDFDTAYPINNLVKDIPGFVCYDITVGHVFDLMMGDAEEYIRRLDVDWVTMVYRLHHQEVIDWCELNYADLVDRDYQQQAVNFVMASTVGWCKRFCEVYSATDNVDDLSEKVDNCKVFHLDTYRVRLH